MKNIPKKVYGRLARLLPMVVLAGSLFVSCKEGYFYDEEEPAWLGGSVYECLEKDGRFDYTLNMIKDLKYVDEMNLTGSKTLFVATDSAFDAFFASENTWGVHSYSALSTAQKKMLLNYYTINNAFLTETISDYYDSNARATYENSAMRRKTQRGTYDSIPYEPGSAFPSNKYWDFHRSEGMYLLKDETDVPLVFFSQGYLDKQAITDEDFQIFSGGKTRANKDFHVFSTRVVEQNKICKNGYVNVMESVLIPPSNMAQYIKDNPKTQVFSKLLDRFCAPFYDQTVNTDYRALHNEFTDSIFVKRYFASNGGSRYLPYAPNATTRELAPSLLNFDPGWNNYQVDAVEPDMAAIFVPSDEALNNYFNSGVGEILKSRFGSLEAVPNDKILPFLKRHMRSSFVESVPSRFSKMVDTENFRLPVETSNIEDAYTAVNGEVYVVNEVYPPVDYISVYSPVLMSSNSRVFDWAINITESSTAGGVTSTFAFYKLYLNSLVSNYALFVPTDEYFNGFLDPISFGQEKPGAIKYWFNEKTNAVNATLYLYDRATGTVGTDSVGVITDASFLKNRLWDMLDSHIVVGDVKGGDNYYVTKGNEIIKVEGTGTNMTVQGGYDLQMNTKSHVSKVFEQDNGTTYFLDKPIQDGLKSVYSILSEKFPQFYALLNGVPDTCVSQIFKQQGLDFRVNFFNAYRYTIYAPSDSAILAALNQKLITPWDSIYAMPDGAAKSESIQKMIRFLRYHFQDEAVFFGNTVSDEFQSATLKLDDKDSYWKTTQYKYYKIGVVSDAHSLVLTTENQRKASVDTRPGYHNMVAKDYVFDKIPSLYKNVDNTGSATAAFFYTSSITTSASAVIHQIDNVLTFQ
jgi:uncharacterized surface protein with fasciclin (FAS1) repeats